MPRLPETYEALIDAMVGRVAKDVVAYKRVGGDPLDAAHALLCAAVETMVGEGITERDAQLSLMRAVVDKNPGGTD